MWFDIKNKQRPFSLEKKVKTFLPNSDIELTIFPTKVILQKILNPLEKLEIFFPKIEGPVKKFCTFLDLDRGWVEVEGFCKKGFFRYRLFLEDKKICFKLDRGFFDFYFEMVFDEKIEKKSSRECILPFPRDLSCKPQEKILEKLYLGLDKKLDILKIMQRENLQEILPLVIAMGQNLPNIENFLPSHEILDELEMKIAKKEDVLDELFLKFVRVGFDSLLHPEDCDHFFQGILTKNNPTHPITNTLRFARLIRRLFFEEDQDKVYVLPYAKLFLSGKFVNIFSSYGAFHMEWRQKRLRRCFFDATCNDKLRIIFPKQVKNFRQKSFVQDRGTIAEGPELCLDLENGQRYFFDLFKY